MLEKLVSGTPMTNSDKATNKQSVSVGESGCDVVGFSNRHLQCAVDQVSRLGGGIVELSEGVFHMADSLHVPSGLVIRGQGERTVLRKNPMKAAKITTYLGYGLSDIEVETPDILDVGEGVILTDDATGGYLDQAGTLLRREGNTWFYSARHSMDYDPTRNAVLKTLYSHIRIADAEDVLIEGLRIDGNPDQNDMMNSCRGGGVYVHSSRRVVVRDVIVRDYNGDGIVLGDCDDVELAGCVCEQCAGIGIHAGSASRNFVVTRCVLRDNSIGFFFCLQAQHGLLDECLFENNETHGVSIGTRDSDNIIRNTVVRGNGGNGIHFRRCPRCSAPDRVTIEGCTIENNAQRDGVAEILLQGEVDGVVVRNSSIRPGDGSPAILVRPETGSFQAIDNVYLPSSQNAIVDERRSDYAKFKPEF